MLAPADIVKGDEVRVRKLRHRLCLAGQRFLSQGRLISGAHRFEGDSPAQLAIPSFPDNAESPAADLAHQLEAPDRRASVEPRLPICAQVLPAPSRELGQEGGRPSSPVGGAAPGCLMIGVIGLTPHRRSRPRDYSSAGYIEQPLRPLVASKCHNFLPRRTHAASGAALKPRLESQIMHSFIKFAAVFALALLAFCGQLAAL